MNILLVGGHQKTQFLIKRLKCKNHNITVINEDLEFCKFLADEYDVPAVCGNGVNPDILQTAKADKMDMVVALQHKDASNLLVCELAKTQFHVNKTVAFIVDPNNGKLFQEIGVDRCLCITDFLTDMIEQETVADSIRHYIQIENGKIVILEAIISESSPIVGQKLWEAGLPPQSIIGSIIRGKETLIPKGNTELKPLDKAIVISTSDSAEQTLYLLTGRKNGRR